VPNQAVSLAVSGSRNLLQVGAAQTDAAGLLQASLGSSQAELKQITATVAGVTAQANVTFLAGPPSALASTFSAAPSVGVADASTAVTLTLRARDAQNNPVAAAPVSLQLADAYGVLASVRPASGARTP
jgi:hypothetical protein